MSKSARRQFAGWVLTSGLAVAAGAGCNEASKTPDSGTTLPDGGCDTEVVDADSGVIDGPEVCASKPELAHAAMAGEAGSADDACDHDEDCVVVALDTRCSCAPLPAALSAIGAEALGEFRASVDDALCGVAAECGSAEQCDARPELRARCNRSHRCELTRDSVRLRIVEMGDSFYGFAFYAPQIDGSYLPIARPDLYSEVALNSDGHPELVSRDGVRDDPVHRDDLDTKTLVLESLDTANRQATLFTSYGSQIAVLDESALYQGQPSETGFVHLVAAPYIARDARAFGNAELGICKSLSEDNDVAQAYPIPTSPTPVILQYYDDAACQVPLQDVRVGPGPLRVVARATLSDKPTSGVLPGEHYVIVLSTYEDEPLGEPLPVWLRADVLSVPVD